MRVLAEAARRVGQRQSGSEEHRDRQRLRQGVTRLAWSKGGRAAQAIGHSPGGWTTKVDALTGVVSRPYALMLMVDNISDMKAAPAHLEQAGRLRHLLANKQYDANGLRWPVRDASAAPAIAGRRNRKRTIH